MRVGVPFAAHLAGVRVCGGSHAGKRISDIMSMTVDEALAFFKSSRGSKGHESRARKAVKCLQPLQDVGLGYLVIGQPVSTLSGGEAQRIKIASELKNTASTYVFDEPTTGLANSDVRQLVTVFDRLVDAGNTVVVITHSLELIVQADWLIDMGPDAGAWHGRLNTARTHDGLHAHFLPIVGVYHMSRRRWWARCGRGHSGGCCPRPALPHRQVSRAATDSVR